MFDDQLMVGEVVGLSNSDTSPHRMHDLERPDVSSLTKLIHLFSFFKMHVVG
jgi:hypothetical protein